MMADFVCARLSRGTMHRLLLLRHAKAERGHSVDRERRLADRGRTDARKIGAYLVNQKFNPDLVIVSPARRTRETWKGIAAVFDTRWRVKYDERLYATDADAILGVLKETPRRFGTLLVIGHNPGIQELAMLLITSGDTEARERLKEKFPTAALAVLDFTVKKPHSGLLERFVTRRLLRSATE